MSSGEEKLRDTLVDCLKNQLSELELLRSMYPNENDLVLTDKNILNAIEEFITNKTEYTPGHLDFVLKVVVLNLKLELSINLPSFYPQEEPEIYVRCNELNRNEETNLNKELSDYLKSNYSGDVCLYTAISWVQDNIDKFYHTINKDDIKISKKEDLDVPKDKFLRFWIYSHHIYNKKKRDEIQKKAKELNLTGFCLPGKPGIILCIEGIDCDCKEWWRYIKSMTWKKIVIRKTEIFEISEETTERKFSKFEEIQFHNSTTSSNNKHADISGLSKFMEERGLSQTFNDFFGLCNNI